MILTDPEGKIGAESPPRTSSCSGPMIPTAPSSYGTRYVSGSPVFVQTVGRKYAPETVPTCWLVKGPPG